MLDPFYRDDYVTLYHGDCREILPRLGVKVDLVATDPPYNIGKKYGNLTDDARDPVEYWGWHDHIFRLVYDVMTDGYLYCFQSDRGVYTAMPRLSDLGFSYIQTLIWWGRNGYSMQLHRNSWSYRHEPILFMEKGKGGYLQAGIRDQWYTSVIEVPRPQSNFAEGRHHATEKPVKLMSMILARTPGDLILDPFLGSGTTAVAAKKLRRKCIGIEIEEEHCETAANRCQVIMAADLSTGQDALQIPLIGVE